MRWIMALLAVLLTVLVIMPARYRLSGRASRRWSLTLKVIPTLMCAAFAGAACFGGDGYSRLMFTGLLICAAADLLLGVHFVTGGALFLAGHLFYMAAFCTHQPPTPWSIPVFGVMLALLWLFCWQFGPRIPNRLMFCGVLLYSAALAVVLCLSLPMPFLAFSGRTVLAALGAAVFVLSDMGVCHGMLCKISKKRDYGYLGIYYLAQLLLGLSAFGG